MRSADARPDAIANGSWEPRPHYNPGIDILVVCTGNLCRSPMAEALLRRRLTQRGIDARVGSAGRSAEGRPASASAVEVMAAEGLDLRGHRSRRTTPQLVAAADLVVAMAREHVRDVVLLAPDALPRTFTLKELVRRGGGLGARADGESLASWLARADAGRGPFDHVGSSSGDDVADPIGRRAAVYERTATELGALVDSLVSLAFPVPARPAGAPSPSTASR
jgi:protein-tyrosine phosphatase